MLVFKSGIHLNQTCPITVLFEPEYQTCILFVCGGILLPYQDTPLWYKYQFSVVRLSFYLHESCHCSGILIVCRLWQHSYFLQTCLRKIRNLTLIQFQYVTFVQLDTLNFVDNGFACVDFMHTKINV